MIKDHLTDYHLGSKALKQEANNETSTNLKQNNVSALYEYLNTKLHKALEVQPPPQNRSIRSKNLPFLFSRFASLYKLETKIDRENFQKPMTKSKPK